MSEPIPSRYTPICPYCGGHSAYRTRRAGLKEWLLRHLLNRSPYRCLDCYERFFHHRLARRSKEGFHHHAAS